MAHSIHVPHTHARTHTHTRAQHTRNTHTHMQHTHVHIHKHTLILTIAWVDPNTVLQGTSKNTHTHHNILHSTPNYHYSPVVMDDSGILSYTSATYYYY